MKTFTFDQIADEIKAIYGNCAACEIPSHEFSTGGLFGDLAKSAGIESPGAYALVNNWNAWNCSVSKLIELFLGDKTLPVS